jgi:hypothetical protein
MKSDRNLGRIGLFRRIGAFSVDATSPVSVRASLDDTCELLHRPGAGRDNPQRVRASSHG